MVGHKDICERFIKDVLRRELNNINKRELKCDYALESDDGIECFEAEASTETTNESDLHILGHLIYMVLLNRDEKIISKFYWLVGPGLNYDDFKLKVEGYTIKIKKSLKKPETFPDQLFHEFS